MSTRSWGLASFGVAALLLAGAIGLSERYPMPGVLLLVAFVGVHVGAGLCSAAGA